MGHTKTKTSIAALVFAMMGCGSGSGAPPPPLTGAIAVSLSRSHACALITGGAVRCWGDDQAAAFDDIATISTPVAVPGLTGLQAIAAGSDYTCGLKADGSVICWGLNLYNELGSDTADAGTAAGQFSTMPIWMPTTDVVGLGSMVLALATAGSSDVTVNYSCALMVDETVRCWGVSALGLVAPDAEAMTVTPVPGLAHVRKMALADSFGCFVLDDGTVSCLGNVPLPGQPPPGAQTLFTMPGLSNVRDLAAGTSHVCALIQDGTVQCWGNWLSGTVSTTPVPVPQISGATGIAAGTNETCVLVSDGSVMCWGEDGVPTTPARVQGLGFATSLSVGDDYACVVIRDGTIQCWGNGAKGRLGDGKPVVEFSNQYVTTPTAVVAGDGGT